MAASISFQNGNGVYTENNPNHDVQFSLNGEDLFLNAKIRFIKGTANLKLNQALLNESEFEMGEVEIRLDKPIGKENILVHTSSAQDRVFLNIKIELNTNATKKYMFGQDGEKKWMFGN